jgi:hypothetical protein
MTNQPTIRQRAKTFEKAIESYGTGSAQEIFVDLLTDAMHWCDANGEDFHICLAMACRHFIHELNDEQQDERRLNT